MIPSTKQFEDKLGPQTRKKREILQKNLNFRVVLTVVNKVGVRDDDNSGDLDIAVIDLEVNDFPFERHTRVGMRYNNDGQDLM